MRNRCGNTASAQCSVKTYGSLRRHPNLRSHFATSNVHRVEATRSSRSGSVDAKPVRELAPSLNVEDMTNFSAVSPVPTPASGVPFSHCSIDNPLDPPSGGRQGRGLVPLGVVDDPAGGKLTVGMRAEDLARNVHISGQGGNGLTDLVKWMVFGCAKAGYPIVVVDPYGSASEDLLALLLAHVPERRDDLVFCDLSETRPSSTRRLCLDVRARPDIADAFGVEVSASQPDFGELINDNKIVIVKLSRLSHQRNLAEELGKLLIPSIIDAAHQAGLRQDGAKLVGTGSRLFVLNAAAVMTDRACALLPAGRRHDVGVVMHSLAAGPSSRAIRALAAGAANHIAFGNNPDTAKTIVQAIDPEGVTVEPADIALLPPYSFIANVLLPGALGSATSGAFTATNLPPLERAVSS